MGIYIGTSGYSYPYWKNRFYPERLAAAKQLAYYASVFNSVELNYTFYRFPTLKSLQKAYQETPAHFRFSVKMNKIVTHTLRMNGVQEKVAEFMDIINNGLAEKLACVLFQLPPSFSYTPERLEMVLRNIEHNSRNVIEFRHISWWQEEVYAAFREAGLTFCSVSFPGLPETIIQTSHVCYTRMHGVPELFKSSYTEPELQRLATALPDADTSFTFFNNTMYEAGYSNALTLRGIV